MKEINYEELKRLPKDSYAFIDIRDEGLRNYGVISGAIEAELNDDFSILKDKAASISFDKKLIFYCEIGRKTRELEVEDILPDRECYSLEGGYIGYVRSLMNNEEDLGERQLKAEESIRKKFHKQLFTPFAKACKTYKLIEEGDCIAVCISGGKDSMLMAKLFQEIFLQF